MNIKYLGVGIAIGIVIGAGGLYLVLSQEFQNKSILTSEQKLNENTELKQTETERGQETKTISFPYSWVKDNIKITIYGVLPTKNYVGGGTQYAIPITYENLLKESYQPYKKGSVVFDNIRLETDKENIWDVDPMYRIVTGYKFDPLEKLSRDEEITFSINGDENPQNILLTLDGKTYTLKARLISFEELGKQGFY